MVQKFSHGRGGAGNIAVETVKYVDGLTYSPPILSPQNTSRYTTGRGGAGNIRKYDAVEVRRAQDVPEGPQRIPHYTAAGRGGAGNLQAAKKREAIRRASMSVPAAERTSVDSTRSNALSSTTSRGSTSSSISELGIADWGKNLLFGRRNSSHQKA